MAIQANELYYFTKSGNQVRAIAPAEPHIDVPCWTVERICGASVGKQMIVPHWSLSFNVKGVSNRAPPNLRST